MSRMKLSELSSSPDRGCDGCGSCIGRRTFFRMGLGAAAALTALRAGDLGAATAVSAPRSGNPSALRYPVPTADGVTVDRSNEVILVRQEGEVMAFALSCPHQRSMLRWRDGDGIFQCSKHHSEYTPAGVYEKGRATRNMDRLAVKLDGSEVVVDRTTTYHSDENPQAWESAVVEVG